MDEARKRTDKLLSDLERRVSEVYADPSLLRMERKYEQYMKRVEELTVDDYRAFSTSEDIDDRKRLKTVYKRHVESLTTQNRQYKDIVTEFNKVLSDVNQKALDIINDSMAEIYAINYNQIAGDCERLGIKVNGKEK